MNIDIEFIPTWVFNFKDLPIKINYKEVYITGTAEGYSANMYNNQHDKSKIVLSLQDIEGIQKLNIESFITEDMKDIGINKIPFETTFSFFDKVDVRLQVENKLKDLIQ